MGLPSAPHRDYQVGGSHYVAMAVQPWDAMRAWLSPEGWRGFLHGNALKYLARAGTKGPAREDLEKAAHYLAELVHTYQGEESPEGEPRHRCPLDGCHRPGVSSFSTTGEGPYFCREHFRDIAAISR
jgi:hypothetical protein